MLLIHLILGLLIGWFVAPNKKVGFAIGCVFGVVWGIIQMMFLSGEEIRDMETLYMLNLLVMHGLITGLFALVATHGKMRRKAKSMQALNKK